MDGGPGIRGRGWKRAEARGDRAKLNLWARRCLGRLGAAEHLCSESASRGMLCTLDDLCLPAWNRDRGLGEPRGQEGYAMSYWLMDSRTYVQLEDTL